MPGPHPPCDRVLGSAVVAEVAVDPMVNQSAQCLFSSLRRSEVHVRDPHGDALGGRNAEKAFHHVPFHAVGAAAVDDLVEIH